MKQRILLISLVLLLAVSITPVAATKPPEVHTWRVQSVHAAGVLGYKVFVEFTERVKERSGGRLIIKPMPDKAITGTFKKFDAVRGGVFEGFHSLATYWTGKEPAFAVLGGMPMGIPYTWQVDDWYRQGGGRELAQKLYGRFGLYSIGMVPFGPDSMHFRVPVATLADLKGVKFRSMPGMGADLLARLGAKVVIMPGGEVYSALEKGVIDGADFMTLGINYGLGFHEVARYFITVGIHQPVTTAELVVRKAVWNALPDDLKAIVKTEVEVWAAKERDALAAYDRLVEKKMLERGNVKLDFSKADRVKAREVAKKVWDDWAKRSPIAAEITKSKMEYMRVHGL